MTDSSLLQKGYLSGVFDQKRAMPDGETLERIRHNYYIQALTSESDELSIGGLTINQSGRGNYSSAEKKKRDQAMNEILLLSMLEDQLADIEQGMIDKYGEDFAENLAAEYLDTKIYMALMKIDDPQERRRTIADAINTGIQNGTIDSDKVLKNPDNKEWLIAHEDVKQEKLNNAEHGITSTHDGDEKLHLSSGLSSLLGSEP